MQSITSPANLLLIFNCEKIAPDIRISPTHEIIWGASIRVLSSRKIEKNMFHTRPFKGLKADSQVFELWKKS